MPYPKADKRFAADAMLGRLARWLRALGYDTQHEPDIDDHDLVARADAEERIVLTRDRHLVTYLRPRRALLLSSGSPQAQLLEVAEHCGIGMTRDLFTRCLVCNQRLRAATDEEIATLVPDQARDRQGPFLRCPGCGRVYWPGSHVRRMRSVLEELFSD
ncbi:MAG: Mut7-C RNAse domain-containing protein [Marinobacter sp.]